MAAVRLYRTCLMFITQNGLKNVDVADPNPSTGDPYPTPILRRHARVTQKWISLPYHPFSPSSTRPHPS
jgi:hypothetical protein